MTIRPIDFNGMIQNTNEISGLKSHEDQRPLVEQQVLQTEFNKQEERMQQQVGHLEKSEHEEFRYGEKEGNGSGYQGQKKKGKNKKKENKDGQVFIKNDHQSFDIKI